MEAANGATEAQLRATEEVVAAAQAEVSEERKQREKVEQQAELARKKLHGKANAAASELVAKDEHLEAEMAAMAQVLAKVQDKMSEAETGMDARVEQYSALEVAEARAVAAGEKAARLKAEGDAATKLTEVEAAHASELAAREAQFQGELSAMRFAAQLESERFQRELAENQTAAAETDAKLSAAEAELSVREALLAQA
jgi:chromosome segregation ATPase